MNIQLNQKTPTANDLMNLVVNEYDRLLIQNGGKLKLKGEDAAFLGNGNSQKGKQRQYKPKFPYACNNCGWNGHKKEDCWEEGGGKAGQAPKGWKPRGKQSKQASDDKSKPSGSNADASKPKSDAEPDGVWLASSRNTLEISMPQFQDDIHDTVAMWSSANEETIELYDSGASQHMSPYCDRFLNFKSISLHPIQATDKHTFEAIGRGDLPIEVPNGKSMTQILLTNVLYAPSMVQLSYQSVDSPMLAMQLYSMAIHAESLIRTRNS